MNKKDERKNEYTNGITLIALIITIIVLLILAGVTLSLTLGEKGIFNIAKQAGTSYQEQQAREKLELVLLDLQSAKITDSTYNDTTYIDKKITNNGMIISGDIVLVDGWQFEIDRSVPKIGTSLGKGEKEKTIAINIESTETNDYVKANVVTEISYEKEIVKIIVNGEEISPIPEPEIKNGKNVYRIEKEERNNGTYTVLAKDAEEKYNIVSIKVSNLTEDMEIWNKQDMEEFRDKVNSGRTFEGKTARVMDDIKLEGSEEDKWIPIVDYASNTKLSFKGTFEGNNYEITGIYINSSSNYQGLFGRNGGIIKDVKIQGNIVSTGQFIGGIAGENHNTILNCQNNVIINAFTGAGGIVGQNDGLVEKCCNAGEIYATDNLGGIIGYNSGMVKESYNTKSITAEYQTAGGIVGYNTRGKIYNCYNIGTITSTITSGGISGAGGEPNIDTAVTYNCYNIGSIKGNRNLGQITGLVNANGGRSEDRNCYTTNATAELLNAGEFSENVWVDDETGINNGYPVLKWQVPNTNKE